LKYPAARDCYFNVEDSVLVVWTSVSMMPRITIATALEVPLDGFGHSFDVDIQLGFSTLSGATIVQTRLEAWLPIVIRYEREHL